jgi:hypothetical protein
MIQSHNLPSQQSVKCYFLPTTQQSEQIRVSCFFFYIKASETKEFLLVVQLPVTGLFVALKNKDIGFFTAFHETKYLHAL